MKTEYQKCMDEEPFDGSSPEITEMTVRNKRLLHQLRETDYADNEAKQRIYRQMFGSIGKDVYIDISLPMRVWEKHLFREQGDREHELHVPR